LLQALVFERSWLRIVYALFLEAVYLFFAFFGGTGCWILRASFCHSLAYHPTGWRQHCMFCSNLYTNVVLRGQRRTFIFSSDVAAQSSCIPASCIFTGMNGVIVISDIMLYEIIISCPNFLLVSGIKLYRLFPKAILPPIPWIKCYSMNALCIGTTLIIIVFHESHMLKCPRCKKIPIETGNSIY